MRADGTPDVTTNAGRCDICGKFIDMRHGDDELVIAEFGDVEDQFTEEYGLTDQDAIDAVADALERVAETPEGSELAKCIRETGWMRVHGDCLDGTNYSQLETEVPSDV